MRQEPVRGDPGQGICVSLEKIEDLADCPEISLQWKCSCWSTADEFLLEWNINVPTDLESLVPNGALLSVSQLGFFKYNEMVYVLVAWTRKYIWVYCHDIRSFTEMYSQGVNISVEPKIYNLELHEDSDLDSRAESSDENGHSLSLAIKTGEGEFQFVLSTSNLELHTLRLTVSGEIAQVLGISVSSNWWNIATYSENSFETEDPTSDSTVFAEEAEHESRTSLRDIVGLFKSAWNSGERTPKSRCKEVPSACRLGGGCEANSRFLECSESARFRAPLERIGCNRKLRRSDHCEDILILSFPSSYIRWNVSFMCFITAESCSGPSGKRSKTLILFRHDSFGVVELCWTLSLHQIGDSYPSSLIAVPLFENTKIRIPENSRSTVNAQINILPGGHNKFGLFFVYKSNRSIQLLQLIPNLPSSLPFHENRDTLAGWMRRPSINTSQLYEIVNSHSFGSNGSDNPAGGGLSLLAEMSNLEQNISLLANPRPQGPSLAQKLHGLPETIHNCILRSSKHIFTILISGDGHELICSNILDHSNHPNKIYFATYSQNTLYLLVNYQDVPLKIDLSSPSNNPQEYLNPAKTTENENGSEGTGNSSSEFNKLIAKYRGLRNGELSSEDAASESLMNKLERIQDWIAADLAPSQPTNTERPSSKIKLIKTLSLIGETLNHRISSGRFAAADEEATLLWGKCSLLLDLDYWKDLESTEEWEALSEETCFDQVTSKFPNLKSYLLSHLDVASIISSN
ncbi:hypothetical protein OIY81_1145 [Cryptosporidium canis]|nr:hypothetical protein OIY81_1145 [Cryptosporidium canis]